MGAGFKGIAYELWTVIKEVWIGAGVVSELDVVLLADGDGAVDADDVLSSEW